jgi:hypothetical protein
MKRYCYFLLIILLIPSNGSINCAAPGNRSGNDLMFTGKQDTIDEQIIFNGRAWRNLYIRVKGDPFLFTTGFVTGTVTVNGRTFDNLKVSYDAHNDEVLTMTGQGIIIQLNRERVDGFTMDYNLKTYRFKRYDNDTLNGPGGYLNILHDGSLKLTVKYRKEIYVLADNNKYDVFQQTQKIYVKKDETWTQIRSKSDLLKLLTDKKQQIRNYISTNKIKISKKDPESFLKVIVFYENLSSPDHEN